MVISEHTQKVTKNKLLPNKSIKRGNMRNFDLEKIFSWDFLSFLIFTIVFLLVFSNSCIAATVTVSWTRNQEPDIAGYKIYYGTKSKNYTNTITVHDTATSPSKISYVISGLPEGQTYYFALKAFNTSNQFSDFSEEVSLYIPPSFGNSSVGVTAEDYCSPQAISQKYEWIKEVKVGNFVNSSGPDAYGDFTDKIIPLNPGQNVPITLTPGFASKPYDEYWRVWIDFNNDGDFDDAGELVLQKHGTSTISGSIQIPNNATGTVRMRIGIQYRNFPHVCSSIKYGEFEDYMISFDTNEGFGTETSKVYLNSNSSNSNNWPQNLSYCTAQGTSQKYEWIKEVKVGNFVNSSGPDAYGDFTDKIIPLNPGQNVPITLTPEFASKPYDEYWSVWIDFNNDGDFDDAGELVLQKYGTSTVSGSIQIPNNATGTVRMRIGMQYKNYPSSACGNVNYGEVEDYTISLDGENSAYSAENLGNVTQNLNYCTVQGTSQKYEWIKEVKVGNFVNSSGPDAYGDFTDKVIPLNPGQNVPITLTPEFASKPYDEYWSVWIDFNNDGDFDDAGELVLQKHGTSTVSGSIQIPNNADGSLRMRIGVQYRNFPSKCGTIKYGEFEDYTILVQ